MKDTNHIIVQGRRSFRSSLVISVSYRLVLWDFWILVRCTNWKKTFSVYISVKLCWSIMNHFLEKKCFDLKSFRPNIARRNTCVHEEALYLMHEVLLVRHSNKVRYNLTLTKFTAHITHIFLYGIRVVHINLRLTVLVSFERSCTKIQSHLHKRYLLHRSKLILIYTSSFNIVHIWAKKQVMEIEATLSYARKRWLKLVYISNIMPAFRIYRSNLLESEKLQLRQITCCQWTEDDLLEVNVQ